MCYCMYGAECVCICVCVGVCICVGVFGELLTVRWTKTALEGCYFEGHSMNGVRCS